ncbi:MAG: hypothetical protein M3250_00035, partial [Thermoproteota archaeon]|nr:hypothetical protein [Thermoproteota archaeon]
MSQVLSEDHRKVLIDIFFSVMIADALGQFVSKFILGPLDGLGNSSILILLDSFVKSPDLYWLDALFFA